MNVRLGTVVWTISVAFYFYCFTMHFCSLSFITNLCTHIYY